MSLDSILITRRTNEDLLTTSAPLEQEPVLVVSTIGQAFGTFRSVSGTVAGTFTVATADPGQSLVVTDILISSKKKAGSTLTFRFSDGTDTVNIFAPDTVTGQVNFGTSLEGHWQGWAGADIEVVTVADVVFTATVGYYKVVGGDAFGAWDAKR